MYDKVKEKLLLIVKDENIAQELLELLTQDVYDKLFLDLSKVVTEVEIKQYENRIKEAKSIEHAKTIIDEIAYTIYGANAENELLKEYARLISELENDLNNAFNLIQKAKQGDTQAQQLLQDTKQSNLYQQVSQN